MSTSAPPTDKARIDILRLAQAARPWDFLSQAIVWLKSEENDHGVRFLAASNAADLGLRTLAREFLRPLPPEATADDRVRELLRRIDALADDEIPCDVRRKNAIRGLEALTSRGHNLDEGFNQWERSTTAERWFAAIDGNIIRWTDPASPLSGWQWLADHKAEAHAFCQSTIECDAYTAPPPVVIDGIAPPWILLSLIDTLKKTRTGYITALHLLQSDTQELFDALACVDLHDNLLAPQVHMHLGSHAGLHLKTRLEDRLNLECPGRVILTPTTQNKASPSPLETIKSLRAHQQTEVSAWSDRVNAAYGPRDSEWWAARFASINDASAEPLKILIITSRYTTFVQHAASDLANAVQSAGGVAKVLIEPDDASRLSTLAYLKAVGQFQPDLCVLINYTRAHFKAKLPENLPVVCWIQDAMGHLFDPKVGAAQGPFDALIGHYYAELFQSHGYDLSRFLHTSVAVCENKFHPGPCTETAHDQFECEIAYVSHHSETPEQMLARLQDETEQPEITKLLETLAPLIREQVRHLDTEPMYPSLRTLMTNCVEQHLSTTPPPSFLSELLNQFAIPLAERIIRHEMLEWTGEIARRNGWRFRIYGNNWDQHPTLSPFAAGPLDHNDDLRTSYQLARVNLHASVSPLIHQRLMECALSGGFPLARLNYDALVTPERAIAAAGFRPEIELPDIPIDPDPSTHVKYGDRCRLADHAVGYRLSDSPTLLARAAQLQRLGRRTPGDEGDVVWCNPKLVRTTLFLKASGQLDWNASALFGNIADHTFTSRTSLEAQLTRVIEDDSWRQARSRAMAARIKAHATHKALFTRLIDWFPTTLRS